MYNAYHCFAHAEHTLAAALPLICRNVQGYAFVVICWQMYN